MPRGFGGRDFASKAGKRYERFSSGTILCRVSRPVCAQYCWSRTLGIGLNSTVTRHNNAFFLAGGKVLRGWTRSASGDPAEGLAWIDDGIDGWRATGAMLVVSYYLALKAEALYLGLRTSEALEAISEAEALAERAEDSHWRAELYRLRGVFCTGSA